MNITYGAHLRGNYIELRISNIKVRIVSCKEIVKRGFTYPVVSAGTLSKSRKSDGLK
jgi:hypothetical protein